MPEGRAGGRQALGQWLSQRLTWPATWAQVCWRPRPGPRPAPPQAGPSPAPDSGSGNSCAGGTERAPIPSGCLGSAMEPVEAWTPGKVAAWLRGGWGRGRVGLEGALGAGEAKEKGPAEAASWLVCQQVFINVCPVSGTVLGRDEPGRPEEPEGVFRCPSIPRGCQGSDGEALGE